MSYMFEVSGSTKSDVLQKIDAEMASSVAIKPEMQSTQKAVVSAMSALLDSVTPSSERQFVVTVHGGLEWDNAGALIRTSFSGQVVIRKRAG